MDIAALRDRVTTTYRTRRDQALDLIERVPILGRLVTEFVRIEFIDRCMLIAAQGLLALIPMLVVIAAFFPQLTSEGLGQFSNATGLGQSGSASVSADIDISQVRAQTGVVGLLITFFSATSFARAIQRMYERTWQRPHVGGVVGMRRCLLWLVGWLATLQLAAGVVRTIGPDGPVGGALRIALQALLAAVVWLVTSRLLLFGRVAWRDLVVGAVLTGGFVTVYSRGASVFMPAYVRANADQFGTLGVVLSISTWLIGFAGILVASALVGRIVSEDPTVRRIVSSSVAWLRAALRPVARAAWPGARRGAGPPRSRGPGST